MILTLLLACAITEPAARNDDTDLDDTDLDDTDLDDTDLDDTDPSAADGGAPASSGVLPIYDPEGIGFLSTPWPSDDRVDAAGHPDLSTFPNPVKIPLIDRYLALMETQVGFGTNTPIFIAFDGDIDTTRLPDATGSLATDATLQLVDIDPDSPAAGQRVPLQWDWLPDATVYLPAHTLAVAPVFGFPLRPATTYALVLTTAVADRPPGFDGDLSAVVDDVAIATTFTTTDPFAALVSATTWVREEDTGSLSQTLELETDAYDRYDVHTGSYLSPVFQEGTRPYQDEGGGLVLDADGDAEPPSWDEMRLALSTPKDLSDPPPDGWPLTIVLHGTYGDYISGCCEGDHDREHAAALAAQGVLTLGTDLPLHGTRGGDLAEDLTDLEFPYNIFNPDSGRSVQRQSAIDAIYLAHALAQGPTFTLADGTEVPIDPTRVTALGHSQGGLSLALAIPFFGDDVQAAVMSGTGGGIAITLLERTDPFPIGEVLASVLQLGPDETLTELHPVAGLVQWLSEVTDPLNTAPYWFSRGGLWEGQRPLHVLHYSGLLDEQSTYRTAEALAAAGATPVLTPAATWPESWDLAGLTEQATPLSANATGFQGSLVTAAFSQWEDEGHGVLYDNDDAAGLYAGFIGSQGDAEPIVP